MKKGFLLFLFCLFTLVPPSFACDCDGEEATLEVSLSKSTSVFVGKVVGIKNYKPAATPEQKASEYYIIEFQPEEVFKGERTKKISVLTEATVCGGDFIPGKSYLVFTFTNEREMKLEYNQCFRMLLSKQNATEEIAKLRTKN